MNGNATLVPQLVPLIRTKTIHLIRHGEGYHNIGMEGNLDAHLTPTGWKQAAALKAHIQKLEPQLGIQVVIVSPLTRTLETAVGVFGGEDLEADSVSSVSTLMMAATAVEREVSARKAIALPQLPFVASELCRERICPNRCDRRRPLSETKAAFPGVQFSDDILEVDEQWEALNSYPTGEPWYTHGENASVVSARCKAFLEFLKARPETVIAVVAHAEFLSQLLQLCGDSRKDPRLARTFRNCEMRSVVMVTSYTQSPAGSPGAAEQADPTAFPRDDVFLM